MERSEKKAVVHPKEAFMTLRVTHENENNLPIFIPKEYFGIAAKKIEDKKALRDEGHIAIDFDDLRYVRGKHGGD